MVSGLRVADLAIETDTELRSKFASDEATLSYLTGLLAASTAIYERDLGVRLQYSYLRLWSPTATDPGRPPPPAPRSARSAPTGTTPPTAWVLSPVRGTPCTSCPGRRCAAGRLADSQSSRLFRIPDNEKFKYVVMPMRI